MSLIDKPGNRQPNPYTAPVKMVRPPAGFVIAQAILLVLVLSAFFVENFTLDVIIAFVGVFGSVLLFGVTRMIDDRRRSNPSYADWSFVSERRVSLYLMLATWIASMVHVYFIAVEMTRGLT
jgi:hypothetical protein